MRRVDQLIAGRRSVCLGGSVIVDSPQVKHEHEARVRRRSPARTRSARHTRGPVPSRPHRIEMSSCPRT